MARSGASPSLTGAHPLNTVSRRLLPRSHRALLPLPWIARSRSPPVLRAPIRRRGRGCPRPRNRTPERWRTAAPRHRRSCRRGDRGSAELMAKRGISLLDLAAPFPGSQALVPDALAERLENLAVIAHRSTVSTGAIVRAGVVQPVSDVLGFPSLRSWPVEVPGLNTGLPFRLVRTRTATGAGQTLEPAGAGAFLDLVVDRIAITGPGLRPATLVPSAPAEVAHLLPDTTRSGVKIVGAGVVRIDLSGAGDLVRFVDWPDPFDPAAPSGAVYRVTFDPVS